MSRIDKTRLPEAPPDHYWKFDEENGWPELCKKDVVEHPDFVCWGYKAPEWRYTIFIGPTTSRKATRSWSGQGEDAFYNDMHVAVMCVTLGQWED